MPRTLTYAGKNLSDFSVWWDNSRIFNKPAKLFDSFSIPNRNGALLTSLRKFENIQIEYDCYIKDNFAANYADLVDYLTSFETYQRLENSEEPVVFIANHYNVFGPLSFVSSVREQRSTNCAL